LSTIAFFALVILGAVSLIGLVIVPTILAVLQLKHIIPIKSFIPTMGLPGGIAFISVLVLIITFIIFMKTYEKINENVQSCQGVVYAREKSDLQNMMGVLDRIDKIVNDEYVEPMVFAYVVRS
jgi:hypothetical protein